jgi:hypothetical protein
MQMALGGRAKRRTVLIVLLLCAVSLAQFAALQDNHTLHFANDHCCLLCHVGVLPFLQPDTGISAAPAAPVEWLAFSPGSVFCQDALLVHRDSRAPPFAA